MRKLLISTALVVAAAAAATPAAAQYRGNQNYGYGRNYGYQKYDYGKVDERQNINAELSNLERNIQRARQNGRISSNEYARLRREIYSVRSIYYRYARGGISQRENYDLQRRMQNLRQQLREDRWDRNGRWDRNDRNDRDDRWDRRDRDDD